jgi:hypothetical protein
MIHLLRVCVEIVKHIREEGDQQVLEFEEKKLRI